MSADELRQAANALRERAESVRRPYAQQELVDVALADWLDAMAVVWDGGGKYAFGSTEQRALAAIDGEPDPTSLAGRAFTLARLISGGAS